MNKQTTNIDSPAPYPAASVQNLRFAYHKHGPVVLDIPNWSVEQGAQVFLQGRSGSGKSTLLNLLTGVLQPTSGSVEILGQNLGQLSNRRRDRFRAAHIGFVFQQFNLLPYLSVADNILLAAYFNHQAGKDVHQRMLQLLQMLGLDEHILNKQAAALSVGQQQRVAIARALINDPKMLIVDEPTSSLDSDARDAFMRLLLRVTEQGNKTLLFVSHDQSLAHHFSNSLNLKQINKAALLGDAA